MGVHGLWRLLDSFGTVLQPDDLKGKRVAIDASIWIAQFRARLAPGEDVEHKMLEGFLARILKLLFYGIKPVFVFDGQASSSKGAEHHRRMRQRAINAQALLKRHAKQILMAQVAAGTIDLEALRSAMAADKEEEKDELNGAKGKESVSQTAATRTAKTGTEDGVEPNDNTARDDVSTVRTSHHGKRHRGGGDGDVDGDASHSPRRRRRRHPRRRLLAPEAVANLSTVHFLQDVEGLLEERAKQEARVLHNALHNTSTSLFMGPRRAVEEGVGEAAEQEKDASASPAQRVFVVEDGEPAHLVNAEVISVTDSDVDYDDDDDDDASSSCCAVSPDVERVVEDEDEEGVLQVERRSASSRSPSDAAVLHSDHLARFLASLSQLAPLATTPPTRQQKQQQQERHRTEGAAHSATAVDAVDEETCARGGDAASRPSAALSSANFSASTAVSIKDSEGEESVSFAEEEMEEEEEGEEESASDSSSWTDEEDEDEGEEQEEEDASTASNAANLTWEPFTQRIDPDALLQQFAAAQRNVTPPRAAAEGHHHANGAPDEEDEEYTPVKLGQTFAAKPPSPVVVVEVNSSEDGEGSNSAVCVLTPPGNAADNTALAASGAKGEVASSLKNASSPVPRSAPAPRPNAKRSSVAVVPFELLHVVELLSYCGVPYVLSPAEADAQCAFLARHGLVDAVFTEDSDVLVHGATTVLRGFFSQAKNVVAYRQAELAACGITKTVLVALASLLGCDYADGVQGIGLVGALEALVVSWTPVENQDSMSDSSLAVLHVLQRWRALVQQPPHTWHDVDDEMTVAQFALFSSAVAQWHLLERRPSFPEAAAVEAFYTAEVDDDVTPFTWLPPNWQQIRIFAGALGALSSTWLVQRFELARKECLKREAEEAVTHETGQRRLTEYGARERVRTEWACQKQPRRHAAVLSQLRAVQLIA